MKIILEAEGLRAVVEDEMLEDFSLSVPSDVHHLPEGKKELGRTHIVLVGLLKEDVRLTWEEIDG